MTRKVLMCWSGGKDSALALHELVKSDEWDVVGLLTTVTKEYDRISMHGVRRALLERQAAAVDQPLTKVLISTSGSDEDYRAGMAEALQPFLKAGVKDVAFGDVFLEDVRRYREENLATVGMTGVFPVWQTDSAGLARRFIELGFKAVITCVDTEMLDGAFSGREYDAQLLADLPEGVDPCGENGEFHSFVYDGPIFREPISHTLGEKVLRDERFHYCDVLP